LVDNPQLLPAFRGSRIDRLAKDSIMQDPKLADVITAPDFYSEPDIMSSSLPEWFDITTQRSWLEHLRTYQQRFGPRAEPLFTAEVSGRSTTGPAKRRAASAGAQKRKAR
jgi:hypothetical protein